VLLGEVLTHELKPEWKSPFEKGHNKDGGLCSEMQGDGDFGIVADSLKLRKFFCRSLFLALLACYFSLEIAFFTNHFAKPC
jgi:hypothetical protein